MNKYFYFFDLNEVLIDRYPAKITKFLSVKYNIEKFLFIYSEKYEYDKPKNVPKGSKIIFMPFISRKKIEKLFALYPPNSLTTIAQRIPDLLLISISNIHNIPTFTVQHGLWSDSIERLSFLSVLIKKFGKIKSYTKHAYELSRVLKIPKFSSIAEMYKFFYIDKIEIRDTKYLSTQKLRAKKVFAFDQSWDSYYVNKFGYLQEDLIYIGNPDLLLLKNRNISDPEDAVCYLCQTIVEDGRFLLKDYKNFLQILAENVDSKKKLYIKLHPRSKTENYDILKPHSNVILTNDFPICKYYIGHYTSLLAVAKQITDNILIWKLANHHVPEYFQKFGSIVTDDSSELNQFVKREFKSSNSINSAIYSQKELDKIDPIQTIAENLIKFDK